MQFDQWDGWAPIPSLYERGSYLHIYTKNLPVSFFGSSFKHLSTKSLTVMFVLSGL